MIESFSDKSTERFFVSGTIRKSAGWRSVSAVAKRKLDMMHYARKLSDLRSPPGNKLEQLKGDWKGWTSIRINDQWRIVFRWREKGPEDVATEDYH